MTVFIRKPPNFIGINRAWNRFLTLLLCIIPNNTETLKKEKERERWKTHTPQLLKHCKDKLSSYFLVFEAFPGSAQAHLFRPFTNVSFFYRNICFTFTLYFPTGFKEASVSKLSLYTVTVTLILADKYFSLLQKHSLLLARIISVCLRPDLIKSPSVFNRTEGYAKL